MSHVFEYLAVVCGFYSVYGMGAVTGAEIERERAIRAAGGFYISHRDGVSFRVWALPIALMLLAAIFGYFGGLWPFH